MQRIDAHQHFWKFDPVRDSWITEEMKAIQRDFLPEHLLPVLQQNGFDGCVLVQSEQAEAHNNFLLELAAQNDFIKGIVGWVDLKAPDIKDRLAHYRQFDKIKGFRHVLQSETDRAMMLQPEFMRGIAALNEFDFTYDMLIFTDQLKYLPEFFAAFPDQKFVIDHIAKPGIKSGEIEGWKEAMIKLAEFSNVYCKVSGMITEANWYSWRMEDFIPYLDVVSEAFGPHRILYGSDWPVCLVAGSYGKMLGIVQEYFNSFTAAQQQAFFGGNAMQFYNL